MYKYVTLLIISLTTLSNIIQTSQNTALSNLVFLETKQRLVITRTSGSAFDAIISMEAGVRFQAMNRQEEARENHVAKLYALLTPRSKGKIDQLRTTIKQLDQTFDEIWNGQSRKSSDMQYVQDLKQIAEQEGAHLATFTNQREMLWNLQTDPNNKALLEQLEQSLQMTTPDLQRIKDRVIQAGNAFDARPCPWRDGNTKKGKSQ